MKTKKEILEEESKKEKAVYMGETSYQSGVVLKAMQSAQLEVLSECSTHVLEQLWYPSEDHDLIEKVFKEIKAKLM